MEDTPKSLQRQNPSPLSSSKSNSNNSNISGSSSSSNNGVQTPTTPKMSCNGYPTTFIQADASSFKQVVQMLTGPPGTTKQASSKGSGPIKTGSKKAGFKLHERRNSHKSLKISPLNLIPGLAQSSSGFSPGRPELLSPSLLDFPSLVLSPVSPLITDPFERGSPSDISSCAEEKAIAEKGFYLHPSPITTPRDSEPRLLPLFPLTSPRISGSST